MSMIAKAHPDLNLAENPHLAGTHVLQTLAGHQTGKQDEALLSKALLATWSLKQAASDEPSLLAVKDFDVNSSSLGTYREQNVFLNMAKRFDWDFSLLDAGQKDAVMTKLARASSEGRPHLAVNYQPSECSGRINGHFDLVVSEGEAAFALPLTTPSPSPKPAPLHESEGVTIKEASVAYSKAEQAAMKAPSSEASRVCWH